MQTLNDIFLDHIRRFRDESLLSHYEGGRNVSYSTDRFSHAVYALRRYLINAGLEPGDRVAIFSQNRPEWHVADFAIHLARLIGVPVYPTLSNAQLKYVLEHSGARAVLFAGRDQYELLRSVLPDLPGIQPIVELDGAAAISDAVRLSRVVRETPAPADADWNDIRNQLAGVDPAGVATIIYTSGTTGPPKGVMLSHENLVFDLDRCLRRLDFAATDQALSVLPLAHVFERLLCYGYFRQGVRIAYGNPRNLGELLRRFRPNVAGCVPRVLEKIRETVRSTIEELPVWRRSVALSLLRAGLEDVSSNGASPAATRIKAALARRVVFPKVRRQLGNIQHFVCGGAWLDPRVDDFFRAIGINVLQGYGLTETSPVICLNKLGEETPGSVGRPLADIEVRVSPDGEILTRGGNVMLGYHRDPAGTAAAFTDGWFRTGDLGHVDENGKVFVTGRANEILVLSTGKNVCCPLVERALQRSRFIDEAFLIAHSRKYVTAVLVPNAAAVETLAEERGFASRDLEDALIEPSFLELLRAEIDCLQAEFSHYERVQRFCFLPPDAMLDRELVTPTLKLRRKVLERKYEAWIERMYTAERPFVVAAPASGRVNVSGVG